MAQLPEEKAEALLDHMYAQPSSSNEAAMLAAIGYALLAIVGELHELRHEVASLTKATYSAGGA